MSFYFILSFNLKVYKLLVQIGDLLPLRCYVFFDF